MGKDVLGPLKIINFIHTNYHFWIEKYLILLNVIDAKFVLLTGRLSWPDFESFLKIVPGILSENKTQKKVKMTDFSSKKLKEPFPMSSPSRKSLGLELNLIN